MNWEVYMGHEIATKKLSMLNYVESGTKKELYSHVLFDEAICF